MDRGHGAFHRYGRAKRCGAEAQRRVVFSGYYAVGMKAGETRRKTFPSSPLAGWTYLYGTNWTSPASTT